MNEPSPDKRTLLFDVSHVGPVALGGDGAALHDLGACLDDLPPPQTPKRCQAPLPCVPTREYKP